MGWDQWARNLNIFIEVRRLGRLEARGNRQYYMWPLQMAEKTWVDIEAFHDAYGKALEIHAAEIDPPIDPRVLSDSCAEARKIAKQRFIAKRAK